MDGDLPMDLRNTESKSISVSDAMMLENIALLSQQGKLDQSQKDALKVLLFQKDKRMVTIFECFKRNGNLEELASSLLCLLKSEEKSQKEDADNEEEEPGGYVASWLLTIALRRYGILNQQKPRVKRNASLE